MYAILMVVALGVTPLKSEVQPPAVVRDNEFLRQIEAEFPDIQVCYPAKGWREIVIHKPVVMPQYTLYQRQVYTDKSWEKIYHRMLKNQFDEPPPFMGKIP